MKTGVAYRVVTDQLGSVRQVINSTTGGIVQSMDFDEYGNVTNSIGQQIVPMGFAGGIYDSQTGLTKFGARDYDAMSGRWTVKDPLLFGSGSYNHYLYASNNPVNMIDVGGMSPPLIPPLTPMLSLKANDETAAAAFVIGASISSLICDIENGNTFGITIDYYGLGAGTLNLTKSFFGGSSQFDDPIEAIIRTAGRYFGTSEPIQNMAVLLYAGAAMALTAEYKPALKALVYGVEVLAAAKAGFALGESLAKTGGWK